MDFKAEQMSKVDASVFWQAPVEFAIIVEWLTLKVNRFLNPPAHPGLTLVRLL